MLLNALKSQRKCFYHGDEKNLGEVVNLIILWQVYYTGKTSSPIIIVSLLQLTCNEG